MKEPHDYALELLQKARQDYRIALHQGDEQTASRCEVELKVVAVGYEALYGARPAEDRSMRVKGGGA